MTGTFVFSLDTELVWGSFDHTTPERFDRRYPDGRGAIADVLRLLDRYEISATWAVVGHLFLGACERGEGGRAHPDLRRPSHAWHTGDWLDGDPCTDRARDPLWYGDDIIGMIRGARVPQEIGSHSFSHVIFGDDGCTTDVATSELGECVRVARDNGIELRSFVFPRNSEGHHEALQAHGIRAFRGAEPFWYRHLPRLLRRAAHLADDAIAIAPPVSSASELLPGLWNIPGSMLLLSRVGIRRFVPMRARTRKARKGLDRAVREQKIFHLWCHPCNLTVDRPAMLRALEDILREAARLRTAGQLDISTMGDLADDLASGQRPATASPS
jgi:peptidoglycan/xylan/chitin deacetylase (PgdA/CDA1 family)